MIFTESEAFSKELPGILSEMQYFELQELLMDHPDRGDVVPDGKGLRKIRVAAKGKGKRGGARVIYYWYVVPEKIQFCRIYGKSEKSDISKVELKEIIKELEP